MKSAAILRSIRRAAVLLVSWTLCALAAHATILVGPVEWDSKPGYPWSYAGTVVDCAPVPPSPSGGCVLRFDYPAGTYSPSYFAGVADYDMAATPVDDIWVGHWDYWSPNFTWNHNGTKMDFLKWGYSNEPDPGNMGIGFYGAGCGIPGGTQTDGFTSTPQITWGPGAQTHCWNFSASEGAWHWIQYHAVMNTPGQLNGLFEAFVDGNKVASFTDMAYRNLSSTHFKGFSHDGNWGGGPGTINANALRWVDHTIVATTQAETNMPGGTPPPPPPSAVTSGSLPDVVVTALSYTAGVFTATVKNQGAAATPAGVDIGVGYLVDDVYKTYGLVTGPLAAGASLDIGTAGGSSIIADGVHVIKANVDDINRFAESDETNNQFSRTITVGSAAPAAATDLNGDGTTNVMDVQLAVNQALGASACTNGDVSKDGACNVLDVQLIINTALGVTPQPAPPPAPALSCPAAANGAFTACYFNNTTLDAAGLVLTRTESAINFDWGQGSPDPKVNADGFSAKYEGNFTFSAGDYDFTATADDGVRLFVDGERIIDKWLDQAPTAYTARKTLTAGLHLIRMEYYENALGAVAKLGWTAAVQLPAPPPPPPASTSGRGATLPYIEYEAEDAAYSGTLVGPSRTFGTAAAEASGRRAVRLDQTGQYVRFVAANQANSIVVRYSIPDSPDGAGFDSTISVYVNGAFRQKLPVTSRYSWTYGAYGAAAPNNPGTGGAHHFFDESHALISDVPAGATVTLQKDSGDGAAYYVIDLIDLEQVTAPLPQPAGSISIADCGARADGSDAGPAIQQCINNAKGAGKTVYIPAGNFRSLSARIWVNGVTIQGAGMWHSSLTGLHAGLECAGALCKVSDFALLGDTIVRDNDNHYGGITGVAAAGSLVQNIWIEHSSVGYWVGADTHGLTIRGCRIRDTIADGVNFYGGTTDSVVEQTHLRNTGDDALAAWSHNPSGAFRNLNRNNIFRFNTVQSPWLAQCFVFYGGADDQVTDNVCMDTVQSPGILITDSFDSYPVQGTTQVLRNTLIRAGGNSDGNGVSGALGIKAERAAIAGVLAQDIAIADASYQGLDLRGGYGISGLTLTNIAISNSGAEGIRVQSNVTSGNAMATGVVVTNPNGVGLNNAAGGAFSISRGAGNAGW